LAGRLCPWGDALSTSQAASLASEPGFVLNVLCVIEAQEEEEEEEV